MSQEKLNINSLKELSESITFSQNEIILKNLNGLGMIHKEPLSSKGLENAIYRFYNRKEDTKEVDTNFGKVLSKKFPAYKRHTWSDYAWKQILFRRDGTFLQPNYRGNLIVKKGSQRLLVLPGNYLLVNDSTGSPFVTLSYPSVLSEKVTTESYTWIFGNYYCADIDDNPSNVRFYFNIKPSSEAIINVIEQIKQKFDMWGVPYRFKFLNNLLFFSRADSGVMYVSQKYFFIALHLIKQICDDEKIQGNYLNKDVPHFTYKVTDGIGFAEEPITNQAKLYSFGTWTAHKISESIIDILGGDLNGKVFPKFEYIRDKFKDYLSQLHLNPSSNFPYSFEWTNIQSAASTMRRRGREDTIFGEANTIARILCGEVFWIGENQCTWLTFGKVDSHHCFKSIDDSLMKGRAGIALFLASMYSHNPDRLFRYVIFCTLNTVIENIQLNTLNQEKVNNELAFWQGLHFTFDQAGRIFNENSFTEIAKKIASFLVGHIPFNTVERDSVEYELEYEDFHDRYERMRKVIASSHKGGVFDEKLLKEIRRQYLDKIKPYPNSLLLGDANVNNEEFCPTLSQGLACVGYFFLKMSNQPNVLSIPYEFIDAS